ncbi:hypothetical protein, partial [Micrococcus luteus]|uniref:hypothetical protein n=1 Tax=Micrococcus luteus TaxID=1270 RepID=UPI001C52EF6F
APDPHEGSDRYTITRGLTVRARSVQAPLHFTRLYARGESPLLLPQWRAIPDDEFDPSDA